MNDKIIDITIHSWFRERKYHSNLIYNNNFDVEMESGKIFSNISEKRMERLVKKYHGDEGLSMLWTDDNKICLNWPCGEILTAQ